MGDVNRPFLTAAEHYLQGRPPYSRDLARLIRAEFQLDGSGTLVDVGCGPGVLAVELAPMFDHVVGIDPESAMLDVARRHAAQQRVEASWIEGRAEDLARLGLPTPRLVTFGQSLHWTDERLVLAAVHQLLQPGGHVALITHDTSHGSPPTPPPAPPIPHNAIEELLGRYLGWSRSPRHDTYETALRDSQFAEANVTYAPGRPDIVRTAADVVSNYLSLSFAAPARFGDRLAAFITDLEALLHDASPSDRFHDWPGETVIIWATKRP